MYIIEEENKTARVAQLAEHRSYMPMVTSSSLVVSIFIPPFYNL